MTCIARVSWLVYQKKKKISKNINKWRVYYITISHINLHPSHHYS